jgi:hypothetical protein
MLLVRRGRSRIKGGNRFLEEAIARRESGGYRATADWYCLFLCEVYLQVIAGNEKPPFLVLLKNLSVILNVMVKSSYRIPALIRHVVANPQIKYSRGRRLTFSTRRGGAVPLTAFGADLPLGDLTLEKRAAGFITVPRRSIFGTVHHTMPVGHPAASEPTPVDRVRTNPAPLHCFHAAAGRSTTAISTD